MHFPARGVVSAFSTATMLGFSSLALFPSMALSDNQRIPFISLEPQPVEKPDYVDVHRILMIDVSSSMDAEEVIAAFAGAVGYYKSNEVMVEQKTAICSANTVIFYGTYPKVSPTWIVCNPEDMSRFVEETLGTDIADIQKTTQKKTTESSLTLALMAADSVFEAENKNGIVSVRRSVVYISDEYGGDDQGRIDAARDGLVQLHQASISAISLGDEHLSDRFRKHAISSKELLAVHGIRTVVPSQVYQVATPDAGGADARGQMIEGAIKICFSLGQG